MHFQTFDKILDLIFDNEYGSPLSLEKKNEKLLYCSLLC